MTADRDIERVLEHWLVDGVDRMPDRVYLSILDRVERQPQQRAWRVSWRDPHVNTYLKSAFAIAAVIVIAAAGIAIVGTPSRPGVGGTASPSPSTSPAPSVVPSPSPTLAWDVPGDQCGTLGCGGPLAAGTYTSRSLRPAVTYTLPGPWVNVDDWPDYFQLYRDTPENRAAAAADHPLRSILILPYRITVSPSARCAGDTGTATDNVEMNATEFAQYLATHDGLTTTGPVPVTIGGLDGQQINVSLEPGWTGCPQDATTGKILTEEDAYRFIVLDRPDGGTMQIRIWSLGGPAQPFWEEAAPIVESFQFDLGPKASPS